MCNLHGTLWRPDDIDAVPPPFDPPSSPDPPRGTPSEGNSTFEYVDEHEEKLKVIGDELMNVIEEVKYISMAERPNLIKLIQNKKLKDLIKEVNYVLGQLTPNDIFITDLNIISYGAALYIQRKMAPWHDEKPTPKSKKKKVELPWKVKLQKKIDKLRKELSILVTSGPLTKSVT